MSFDVYKFPVLNWLQLYTYVSTSVVVLVLLFVKVLRVFKG